MSQWSELKNTFDIQVTSARFSVPTVSSAALNTALDDRELASLINEVRAKLGKQVSAYVLQGIIRSVFLIELVLKPAINTTKFEVRWGQRLGEVDPRYASFDECLAIFRRVLEELRDATGVGENCELLGKFQRYHLVPYEIPLDYHQRILDGRLHTFENIGWYFTDVPARAVRLRAFLTDPKHNHLSVLFKMTYSNKVQVKTYLTDRVLTGTHKTNREKRWETHPQSVHFALRRSCLAIEYRLINQLCHFQGVPDQLREGLESADLLYGLSTDYARCPITMEAMSFDEFEREMLDPTHGKSTFQVGHLNPLKAVNDDSLSGHTADNISWISEDGNRIQGHHSLQETREMIKRIYDNYQQFGVEI